MSQSVNIDRFFPFDSIREEQRKAIKFTLEAFKSGTKNVVIQAGTGVGKSAIAVAIARYFNGDNLSCHALCDKAYILTTQKVLQEQYMNDFGPNGKDLVRNIKSASNYTCLFYKEQSCGESRRILNSLKKQLTGTEFHKCCKGGNCTYEIDKKKFIESLIGITNFSYFLSETKYAGALEPRKLLIIDEAHNTAQELSKFIEITFSEKFAKEVLKCAFPQFADPDCADSIVVDWIKTVYKPTLQKHISKLERLIKKKTSEDASLTELSKQYEMLDKHICKINRFIELYNTDNWVLNVIEPQQGTKAGRKFEFKPIDVSSYAGEYLHKFGEFRLFMSATIIDKDAFCRSIGLNSKEVAFIDIPSPFSVENKPVFFLPIGKMSVNHIDKTLPKLVEIVKMLLVKHENEKGIIHTVSFKIAKYIRDNIDSDRLLMHDSENRDLTLKEHIVLDKPTVLLSPSMMEGIDLADDASRFQIICKVPFPYLGDKVIKKRMLKDNAWYAYQTAKSIIQSLGRSIRNVNDHATSYILDEDWNYFYAKNKHLFSNDFQKSLQ